VSDAIVIAHATGESAAQAGLLACRTCGLLSRANRATVSAKCPRCGARISAHLDRSHQSTWAFIIAAAICYIPANTLPVMVTKTVGGTHPDTILGGVVRLYETGSWPLAVIVLVASVMIPLGKLAALGHLAVSVRRRAVVHAHDRARLYRIVEAIGRWSMLDVFITTFVVALVQLGPLMTVKPGAGVFFFMAVVILTMLASHSFDPRSIWAERDERETALE